MEQSCSIHHKHGNCAQLFSDFAVRVFAGHLVFGPELSQSVWSCARHRTMVFNGQIETGNVVHDLQVIPATLESAGRPPKSGYLVDSRKWLVGR